MNVRCPSCETLYRVDPARVPEGGVRARCSTCRSTFEVRRPEERPAAAVLASAQAARPTAQPMAGARVARAEPIVGTGAPEPRVAESAPGAGQERGWAHTPGMAPAAPDVPGPTVVGGAGGARTPAPPAAPSGVVTQPPSPGPQPPAVPREAPRGPAERPIAARAAAPAGPPGFVRSDPHTRARRIARALVSDIVVDNREPRDRALQHGTLRTELREEILKSWEEYVAQVGEEIAKSTPYFRDALNAILAEGKRVF